MSDKKRTISKQVGIKFNYNTTNKKQQQYVDIQEYCYEMKYYYMEQKTFYMEILIV